MKDIRELLEASEEDLPDIKRKKSYTRKET